MRAPVVTAAGGLMGVPQANSIVDDLPITLEIICQLSTRYTLPCV